ncbi:hypothetical protein BGZ94_001778 [Podila epigama]|nr:hypothetical protein BGZ94_001778 [Podila epigama]
MCGFNYVLKKRARFYELLSFRGIRIAITMLLVLTLMVPSGYVMKICVLFSGHRDTAGNALLPSLHDISQGMHHMNVFPICKTSTHTLSLPKKRNPRSLSTAMTELEVDSNKDSSTQSSPVVLPTHAHCMSLFPGPYAPHIPASHSSNSAASPVVKPSDAMEKRHVETPRRKQQPQNASQDSGQSVPYGSWTWLAAGIDIMGSSHFACVLMYPFVNDGLWYFLLCRLQHLHLGFFLLGSASNVYMACKMLSDMYDLVISPPHSRYIKNIFLAQTSVFVVWFWFSYNLMAFRVTATEEEFLSELPLWALRWINVGVAIVDLSYRRIYNRLGRLKVEEELLDIADVEKVEEMQQKAWLHQQQRFLQFSQEQGQYLLGQFKALEVKQTLLNGANAAVDAVSDAYSKSSIPSFSPMPSSFTSAVTRISATTSKLHAGTGSIHGIDGSASNKDDNAS